MTVEQFFSYGSREQNSPYSARSGTVISLPNTQNLIKNYGTISIDSSGNYRDDAGEHIYAKIIEVTRQSSHEIVFELTVNDLSHKTSHSVYRCLFIDDIYNLAFNEDDEFID